MLILRCIGMQLFPFKNYHKLPGCRKCRLHFCFSSFLLFLLYVWRNFPRHYTQKKLAIKSVPSGLTYTRRKSQAIGWAGFHFLNWLDEFRHQPAELTVQMSCVPKKAVDLGYSSSLQPLCDFRSSVLVLEWKVFSWIFNEFRWARI